MEWLRCPLCGKKARGQGIGRAGMHRLGLLRLRSLGAGGGFKHLWSPLTRDLLFALREGLKRALEQVNSMLGIPESRSYVPFKEVSHATLEEKSTAGRPALFAGVLQRVQTVGAVQTTGVQTRAQVRTRAV